MSTSAFSPDAIYFDTNILVRARWPVPSAKLLDLMTQAEGLKIPLCLPELVQRELMEKWFRDLQEKRQTIQNKVDDFNRFGSGIVSLAPPEALERREILQRAIETQVGDFTRRFRQVPLTCRPLTDFLALALARGATFKEGGHGFQDAVILCSILDDMQASGYAAAVAISEDGAFRSEGVAQLARDAGKTLHMLESLDELEKLLKENLEERISSFLAEEKRQLVTAIDGHSAELEAFLTRNLTVRAEDLRIFGSVKSIKALRLVAIENANRSWSWWTEPGQSDDNGNKVSVDAKVELTLQIERYATPPSAPLKVGEPEQPSPSPLWLDYSLLHPAGVTEEQQEVIITVEAEIERKKDGYGGVRFISAYVKRDVGLGLMGLLGH